MCFARDCPAPSDDKPRRHIRFAAAEPLISPIMPCPNPAVNHKWHFSRTDPFKATDEFLDPVFRNFFSKLSLPLGLRKSDYHLLARLLPSDKMDPEIKDKLDLVAEVARKAKPRID
jgi:hypothetical protein